MKRSTRMTSALLGAAVLVATGVLPAVAVHENTQYRANLRQVNDPGAHGRADLSFDDDGDLHVSITTRGLDLGGVHLQHIHGDAETENRCPSRADDTNRDGLVDLAEGAPVYGGILIPLDTEDGDFPAGESYTYEVEIPDAEVREAGIPATLAEQHIVVHGVEVDGEFSATMPALCGEIVQVGGPRL